MKNSIIALALLFIVSACKEKTETVKTEDYKTKTLDVTTSIYPENVTKVFNAHGSIEQWNEFKNLEFTIAKETGDEKTITDLKTRRSFIETNTFALGFDGEKVWLDKKGQNEYNGNPNFYYNLMFYFYAMPFVLGDDGITYSNTNALTVDGIKYPGIKISYDAEIGSSPEDEYILYYNPETFKMEWLAYTVTYFSKEKSKKWSFIKYSNWQTVSGLQLPETLTWYNTEDSLPTEPRNSVQFKAVTLSKNMAADSVFAKPETGEIVK